MCTVYGRGSYDNGGQTVGKYKMRLMSINTRTGALTEKLYLPNANVIDGYFASERYNIYNDSTHNRYILMTIGVSETKDKDAINGVRNSPYATLIVHLDYNYNVLFDTAITYSDVQTFPYYNTLTYNGRILNISIDANYIPTVYKRDIYGNLIQKRTYSNGYCSSLDNILHIPDSRYYHYLVSFEYIAYIDTTSLEPVKYDMVSDEFVPVYGAYYNQQKKALVFGIQKIFTVSSLTLRRMFWDTTTLHNPHVDTKNNGLDLGVPWSSFNWNYYNIKWIDNDIYILSYTPSYALDLDGFSNTDNMLLLQRFDIGGELLWSRTYMSRQDGMEYYPDSFVADNKGDIIVFARRRDLNGNAEQRDIIYFKVDKETGNMIEWEQ